MIIKFVIPHIFHFFKYIFSLIFDRFQVICIYQVNFIEFVSIYVNLVEFIILVIKFCLLIFISLFLFINEKFIFYII